MQSIPMIGMPDMKFAITVSAYDCTGCGSCANVCPGKKGEKALVMGNMEENAGKQTFFDYGREIPVKPEVVAKYKETTVKGSQFKQPLLEFSVACAGCGETPYAKLITQLFGERMYIANATGCSSIWGNSSPSTPYTVTPEGKGPAWSNSLFEDNAEFGLGMTLAQNAIRGRLEQLTNELFGFVKLEHKEMQLHLGKLDLVQLMEQMLDEMTPSFVKNELQVEFLHAEHAIFLEADGELLARLFGNLLNNAVKYGKEGKQIRVSMEKEGEYVVTRVINYGRIIPKQELDHIFQKFYRTEQSRSRDTGGTGLGLAIVQQIAELHHGQVRVKSDLQGTVFEVELPVGMPKGKKEDEKR